MPSASRFTTTGLRLSESIPNIDHVWPPSRVPHSSILLTPDGPIESISYSSSNARALTIRGRAPVGKRLKSSGEPGGPPRLSESIPPDWPPISELPELAIRQLGVASGWAGTCACENVSFVERSALHRVLLFRAPLETRSPGLAGPEAVGGAADSFTTAWQTAGLPASSVISARTSNGPPVARGHQVVSPLSVCFMAEEGASTATRSQGSEGRAWYSSLNALSFKCGSTACHRAIISPAGPRDAVR